MCFSLVVRNAFVLGSIIAVFGLSFVNQVALIAIRTARVRVHGVGITLLVREAKGTRARVRARVDRRLRTECG